MKMSGKGKGKSSALTGSSESAFQVPGTTVFVGRQRRELARIHIIQYNPETIQEWRQADMDTCRACLGGPMISWINVNGIHDTALIEQLGDAFALHPLTREDIANTSQRPKWEEFDGYAFLAMKMLDNAGDERGVSVEHVSLILGPNRVLSFVEDEGDVFESVCKRLRMASGRVRKMPADYLAFCLMDAVVDHYVLAVEQIGEKVELIDDQVISDPKPGDIHKIHRLKQQMLALRRAVWPLREVVGAIVRSESDLLGQRTNVFWRDLYDHTVQAIDMVETSRDSLASLHDTYLSSLSNRMNEVMKVLTVISTIFIPLTFLAGVYGMNFEYMPELKWREGYFLVWAVMVSTGVLLLVYFRKRRWL
jgi:magnesium transporter